MHIVPHSSGDIICNQNAEEELNRFLRSVRVLSVQRSCVGDGASAFWALAVEWLDGRPTAPEPGGGRKKVDYRELLPPEDFSLFAELREWCKKVAIYSG